MSAPAPSDVFARRQSRSPSGSASRWAARISKSLPTRCSRWPRRTATSSSSPAIRAARASSARSARRCRSRSSKSASPSRTWSASRPAWPPPARSRSPFRRPAFSPPGRWSRSRTTSATPTCRPTIVGISAGVSYGALGSTHHSLHDLAALRAIHNLTILVPGRQFRDPRGRPRRRAADASRLPPLRQGRRCIALHPPGREVRGRQSDHAPRRATMSRSSRTGETVVHCAAGRGEAGRRGPRTAAC